MRNLLGPRIGVAVTNGPEVTHFLSEFGFLLNLMEGIPVSTKHDLERVST